MNETQKHNKEIVDRMSKFYNIPDNLANALVNKGYKITEQQVRAAKFQRKDEIVPGPIIAEEKEEKKIVSIEDFIAMNSRAIADEIRKREKSEKETKETEAPPKVLSREKFSLEDIAFMLKRSPKEFLKKVGIEDEEANLVIGEILHDDDDAPEQIRERRKNSKLFTDIERAMEQAIAPIRERLEGITSRFEEKENAEKESKINSRLSELLAGESVGTYTAALLKKNGKEELIKKIRSFCGAKKDKDGQNDLPVDLWVDEFEKEADKEFGLFREYLPIVDEIMKAKEPVADVKNPKQDSSSDKVSSLNSLAVMNSMNKDQ